MQSSHVNESELAQLMPSLEKVNKPEGSGLNHGAGRALSHLLLLPLHPVCMFTACLMKFSNGTCFLSAPTLSWRCCIKGLLLLLSPPTPHPSFPDPTPFARSVFLRLKPISPRISNAHIWPLQPPVNLSLHVRDVVLAHAACPGASRWRGWPRSGELCGGPRPPSLIYSLFFLGSHQTAANSWRDRWRLEQRGQTRGPFGFGFLLPATVPHLACAGA